MKNVELYWEEIAKNQAEVILANSEDHRKELSDLRSRVSDQDKHINYLREKLDSHKIPILEKPINQLTRQELINLNKAIPSERTKKANNTEKIPMPNAEQYEDLKSEWTEMGNESILNILNRVSGYEDLTSYGICPKTFNFLLGYDKNGKIPSPAKVTLFQKVLKFLKLLKFFKLQS